MKIVKWQFENLTINMIDIDGELLTTTNILCEALGVEKKNIMQAQRTYKSTLDNLTVILYNRKELLKPFKEELKITRLRKDTALWSESQMIFLATKVCSEKSTQFILDIISFIKENATITAVQDVKRSHKEEFEALKQDMENLKQDMITFAKGAKTTIGRYNNLNNRAGNVISVNFQKGA